MERWRKLKGCERENNPSLQSLVKASHQLGIKNSNVINNICSEGAANRENIPFIVI